MCIRQLMAAIAGLMMSVALSGQAEEFEATAAPAGDQQPRGKQEPLPPHAYSRRVYKVDHIKMIIGGASEDAKAKVGRLPIQD